MGSENLLLSCFQDFLPERMLQRNALISVARICFESFGFLAQDTPCIERSELLMGKYGENEKLMYSFRDHGDRSVSLRYDLTVPLSRFIKMHANEICFPYRRYQVGPVWRADRPGKGRYREFVQMDGDIVDDDSVLADVEILLLIHLFMQSLGASAVIRINCRQVLDALIEKCGLDQTTGTSLLRVIDKFGKIGQAGVLSELKTIGFSAEVVDVVGEYLVIDGTNDVVLQGLTGLLKNTSTFQSGLTRLSQIADAIKESESGAVNFKVEPTIARGLDYYTGVIFETTLVDNPDFGSVCSGGRYNRLIKHPNGQLLPSIGLSIGIDRLFAALESVNKAPAIKTTTQVFVVNFDDKAIGEYLKLAHELRSAGVTVEIFPRSTKVVNQLNAANNRHIQLAILMGPEEISRSQVVLKDMRAGAQKSVNRSDIVPTVLEALNTAPDSSTEGGGVR